MKATLLLRKDHERVRELLEKLRRAGRLTDTGKLGLVDEIRREVSLHSDIENEVFYTELKDNSSSRDAAGLVETLMQDHRKSEKLLQEMTNSAGRLDESKVNQFIELMSDHIEREEELFSEARRAFSEQRLEELGLEMEYRRRIFTQAVA